MFKTITLAAAALALSAGAALAAGGAGKVIDYDFSFEGPFGTFDENQLQRGLQVYTEVCAACHGLQYVPLRTLADEASSLLADARSARDESIEQQREAERAERLERASLSRANGTGVVFDPDPRTTLRNNFLRDSNGASTFTDAYFTRDLLDIEYTGGNYYLNGPWVNILDWDSPTNPPSTTTD